MVAYKIAKLHKKSFLKLCGNSAYGYIPKELLRKIVLITEVQPSFYGMNQGYQSHGRPMALMWPLKQYFEQTDI